MIKLARYFVGKNVPSLARAAVTFVGSLLMASVLFSPAGEPLDPALAEVAIDLGYVTEADLQDGITVSELLRALLGLGLIGASRLNSLLRARNHDWAANLLGPLIGRSIPSLIRAALTAVSGGLAYLTGHPAAAPEVIAETPLVGIAGAALSFLAARLFSWWEDGFRNPLDGKMLVTERA